MPAYDIVSGVAQLRNALGMLANMASLYITCRALVFASWLLSRRMV